MVSIDNCFSSAKVNDNNYAKLCKITKTGLACVKFSRWLCGDASQPFAAGPSMSGEDTANNRVAISWTYNFLCDTSDTLTNNADVLYTDLQSVTSGCMGITRVSIFPADNISVFFFVSKDKYLFHKWLVDYAAEHVDPYVIGGLTADKIFGFTYCVQEVSVY